MTTTESRKELTELTAVYPSGGCELHLIPMHGTRPLAGAVQPAYVTPVCPRATSILADIMPST